jgi:hypothetical protein
MAVKHVVNDESAEDRTHPAYLSLPEQWEHQVQAIQQLRIGEAFVRLQDDSVHRLRTVTLPKIAVVREKLARIRQAYLERYFVPIAGPAAAPAVPLGLTPPTISRRPGRLV